MTTYVETDAPPRQANERVEITPAVPLDRVRWGPILAGTFAALTALAVLNTLGTAIGLSAWDPADDARRFAIGAGIWGVISLLLSFGLGGYPFCQFGEGPRKSLYLPKDIRGLADESGINFNIAPALGSTPRDTETITGTGGKTYKFDVA